MIATTIFLRARDDFLERVRSNEPGRREFRDFRSGVIGTQEGSKVKIREEAIRRLDTSSWLESMIGTGQILNRIIAAIEVEGNNLIMIEARNGPGTEGHVGLKQATSAERDRIERLAYRLFRGDEEPGQEIFSNWVTEIGASYPVIAYLFFLRDADRFTPIRPKYLEKGLRKLGVEYRMQARCSWENYRGFVDFLEELRPMITAGLNLDDVRLIDAHSFVWVIGAWEMPDAGKSGMTSTYSEIEKAAWILTQGIQNTVNHANGQTVERTVKSKGTDEKILQNVRDLLTKAGGTCQISGLPYQLPPLVGDPDMKASIDRIDSSGDYVMANMQVTCWFINRWKSNDTQPNFIRLLELVRSSE